MKKLLPLALVLVCACNPITKVTLESGDVIGINPKDERVIYLKDNTIRVEFKEDAVYMYSPEELFNAGIFTHFSEEIYNPHSAFPVTYLNNVGLEFTDKIDKEYIYKTDYSKFVRKYYYETVADNTRIVYYLTYKDCGGCSYSDTGESTYTEPINQTSFNQEEMKQYLNILLLHIN